jgi:DNA polymerase-3 subunit alpha
LPEALAITVEIAERCHLSLEFHKLQLPTFTVPTSGADEAGYLEVFVPRGLAEALWRPTPAWGGGALAARVGRHPETASPVTSSSWDFVREAKRQGIPWGGPWERRGKPRRLPARHQPTWDPLRWDLPFRALHQPRARVGARIHVDVCDRRRYGGSWAIFPHLRVERVANIVTFGTLSAKAVVRDVGRVLEVPLPDVDRVASSCPRNPRSPWRTPRVGPPSCGPHRGAGPLGAFGRPRRVSRLGAPYLHPRRRRVVSGGAPCGIGAALPRPRR